MLNRLFFIAILCLSAGSALAEDPAPKAQPAETATKPNDTAPAPPTPVVDMRQVAVGDHWSYDLTDEISGEIKRRQTATVTEVSTKDVTVRIEIAGSDNVGIIIYDNSWNATKNGPQRFSPNDWSGIEQPLEVNKTWKIQSNRIDSNGAVWKRVGESRVTGKESITTKAGQFDTFLIETKFSAQNTNDRSRKTDAVVQTWFDPDINHWVKRSTVMRVNGHVLQNYVLELTGYGRRK